MEELVCEVDQSEWQGAEGLDGELAIERHMSVCVRASRLSIRQCWAFAAPSA